MNINCKHIDFDNISGVVNELGDADDNSVAVSGLGDNRGLLLCRDDWVIIGGCCRVGMNG